MNLELHILQNFAPSNLNRDDTGSPKSCDFGGYRRARISSQCLKRAIRNEFGASGLLPAENRATRTKRVLDAVVTALVREGRDEATAPRVVEQTLAALELKLADAEKTQYLLYLGQSEIQAFTDFCREHWDALAGLVAAPAAATGRGREKKATSQDIEKAVGGKQAIDRLRNALNGGKAADLALFGRMLADLPERNVDAASQVAHAISTHPVSLEFDYYTAVDDLKPEDTAGADMIGTVEFNSACYYRYANIDLEQLRENLQGDGELVAATVRAFLLASRDAEPTGKQNSFAARNKPSFVFAVVRDRGAWSLANAFAKPVRGADIVAESADALARHWGELVEMYDAPAGLTAIACGLGETASSAFDEASGVQVVPSYRELVDRVLAAVDAAGGA